MMRGESLVDECPQTRTNRLAPMPIADAEVSYRIFRKAVEAFSPGLVVDLFPESQKPRGGCGFCESPGLAHTVLLGVE
jgi:hypothetical protein